MIKLILCEGITDTYFLSYYLEKTSGWKYCNNPPKNLTIRASNSNESINLWRWWKR